MINFAWPRNPATLDELFALDRQNARPMTFPVPEPVRPPAPSAPESSDAPMRQLRTGTGYQTPEGAESVSTQKDQSRLPMAATAPNQLSAAPATRPSAPVLQGLPPTPPSGLPAPLSPARPPAPTASAPQPVAPASPAPKRRSYTIDEYRLKLMRATEAGDVPAQRYFQSQIEKGLAMQAKRRGLSGRDHGALPTAGNIADSALQGLTFGFADELAGVGGGIASSILGATGLEEDGSFSKGYGEIRDWVRDRSKNYAERNPVASTAAEIGGGLAFPLGLVRSGTSGLRTAVGSGALYGGGTAEGGLEERLKSAGTGAAAGGLGYGVLKGATGIGKGVFGRAGQKSRGPEFRKKVRTLEDAGIKVTSPERIADPTTRFSEETLRRTFGADKAIVQRPQKLYAELMKLSSGKGYGFAPQDVQIGELSREAVERATKRFGKAYDKALDGVTVQPSNIATNFSNVKQAFDNLLPHERGPAKAIIDGFADQIGSMKTLSGRDYKRLRSGLAEKARRAYGNPQYQGLAQIYRGLRDMLDEGFRAAAPAAKQKLLKSLDRKYGGFKLLTKAADNPEAIGTLANRARANSNRIDKDFRDLVTSYQDVLLRGYPQSSGTAENMAIGNMLSTLAHTARAGTAKTSRAYEDLRSKLVPAPRQRAPKQRKFNAAVKRGTDPILRALQGTTPFVIGQQSPGTALEAIPASLIR